MSPQTILDKFNLSGRVAIVTGGPGLLGREFCRTLAEAGAAVVVADLRGEAAASVAAALCQQSHRAIGVQVDITNPESVNNLVAAALGAFGRVDVLVNSAALDPKVDPEALKNRAGDALPLGAFEDYPLSAWQAALNVNLTGMFLVTQAFVKAILGAASDQGSARASIINICSTYGLNGPDQRIYLHPDRPQTFKPVYYSVTKAGVLGFTKYLAAYYAGAQIRVNALTPGGVFNDHDPVFTQNYSAKTILGRMAHKDEMNGALLYLASDASSYMTGSNLVVDGGWTAW